MNQSDDDSRPRQEERSACQGQRRRDDAPRAKPGAYPFVSKAEVRHRLSTGARAFITACLRIMVARATERAAALLAKYTVQIAEALRLEAMKKEPELVVTAKVYGEAPSHRCRGC